MGTLYLVSTPIGNLEDITIRAIRILFEVDFIACEDTRRTGILLGELRKRSPCLEGSHPSKERKIAMLRFDDHTEQKKTPQIIRYLQEGKNVALISDAGTPLISDPGYLLVRECLKRGIKVVSIPGPSAILTALICSGLPADKFVFLGYPPEKQAKRLKLFQALKLNSQLIKELSPTYIFYCAPHKLSATLSDMKEIIGNLAIVIAHELTKIHESVWRGTLDEVLSKQLSFKGELVILFRIN